MIPRAHIVAWRAEVPWASDAQVEQDLALSRALVEIYSHPVAASELIFRGGTAIHKLFLKPAGRYSEDLDFVQFRPGPIGEVLDAIRSRLDPWLGRPRWKRNEGRVTLVYQFESDIRPVVPLRLKVEINSREHFTVLGLHRTRMEVRNPWFAGAAEVVTYAIEELLATKMRALYQRKKGRDLFDLWSCLERIPTLDAAQVVNCFLRYMEHEGRGLSRAEFEANLADKMEDDAFLADARALLTPGVVFEARKAAMEVRHALIARIPGKPWKKHGKAPGR